MYKNIIILVTTPDAKRADLIGSALLDKRLICAAQNLGKIKSLFFWQNKKVNRQESLLLLISKKSNFKKIEKEVKKLHPYKVPQIISFDISQSNKDYAGWIDEICL